MRKEYDKVNALVGPKETARYNANKAFEEASYRFNSYFYPEPNYNGENYVKDPINTVASVKTLEAKGWSNAYTWKYKELSANKSVIYYTLVASGVESIKQQLANTLKYNKSYLGAPKAGETAATGLYRDLATAETNLENAKKADPVNQSDVDYWQGEVDQVKANIESAKKLIADNEADVEKFAALIATFSGDDLKAYDKAVEDLTVLAEALETAS